jgi:alpha-L-rhamnosidase
MFGGVVRSLFTHILGIQQENNTAGFKKVKISPVKIPGLKWAKGYITTPKGKVTVSISYESDGTMTVKSSLEP